MMNHWLVFRSFTIAPRSSISNTNISVSVFISSAMASWQRLLPSCRTSSSVYARFLGTSTLNLATIFLSPFHWTCPAILPRVGRRRPFRVSILYLRDRVCRSVLRSLKSRFSFFRGRLLFIDGVLQVIFPGLPQDFLEHPFWSPRPSLDVFDARVSLTECITRRLWHLSCIFSAEIRAF